MWIIRHSEIQVGFFNSTELGMIQNGTYEKDEFYNYKMITNIESIVTSKIKQKSHSVCSSEDCVTYSYRILNKVIKCDNETSQFFTSWIISSFA